MDLMLYASGLGRLLGNFQSLELLIRVSLYRAMDPPHSELPKGVNLWGVAVGTVLPENALTSYDSLTTLINRYNTRFPRPDGSPAIDPDLVTLRDALAHGRTTAPTTNDTLVLIKCGRATTEGNVRLEVRYEMTAQFLKESVERLAALIEEVSRTSGAVPASA